MKNRQCYPCTACCEGWLTSDVIEMKPGSPCVHCRKLGCAIYETRPEDPCRNFECGWLQDEENIPEHLRPDLCGAIIMGRTWHGRKVIVAAPVGGAIPKQTLDWLMEFAQEVSKPLMFMKNNFKNGLFVNYKQTGFGPPEFVQEVKDSVGKDDIWTL